MAAALQCAALLLLSRAAGAAAGAEPLAHAAPLQAPLQWRADHASGAQHSAPHAVDGNGGAAAAWEARQRAAPAALHAPHAAADDDADGGDGRASVRDALQARAPALPHARTPRALQHAFRAPLSPSQHATRCARLFAQIGVRVFIMNVPTLTRSRATRACRRRTRCCRRAWRRLRRCWRPARRRRSRRREQTRRQRRRRHTHTQTHTTRRPRRAARRRRRAATPRWRRRCRAWTR
jgi:hypothetical protein